MAIGERLRADSLEIFLNSLLTR